MHDALRGRLRAAAAVAVLVLAGLSAGSPSSSAAGAAAPPPGVPTTSIPGEAHRDYPHGDQLTPSAAPSTELTAVAHPAFPGAGTASPTIADRQALGPGSAAPAPNAPVQQTAFFGMNQVPATSPGWGYPPDTTLAASSARVVQAVNRRLRLSDTVGTALQTRTLDAFFKGVEGLTLFDPKVFYDRNATNPRYYLLALEGQTTGLSRLHLAVSRAPNPGSLAPAAWCRYQFDARVPVAGNAATWADYPGLGTGPNALVMTTNQFNASSQFQYAAVWAVNKLLAANNAAACPAITRYNWRASSATPDFSAFTLQPVQHYTPPSSFAGVNSPAYLLSSFAGTGSLYRVWRIINLSSGSPLLQVANLFGNFTYQQPPRSPGGRSPTGAATVIDTGDTRVLQAAGLGNRLYLAHTTACQFTAGTGIEACARYVAIDVGATTSGAIAAAIRQQTTNGGGDGWYYSYPGVAVNNNGALASAFNVGSTLGFPGSAYASKTFAENDFPGEFFLAQGTCYPNATYQDTRGYNRSGDYTGAQTSPDASTIWVSAERATSIAGVGCGWQTRIARLVP